MNGLPIIRNNVEIVGEGDDITINRSDTKVFRIFEVASGFEVTFKNLIIKGGSANPSVTNIKGGGAILTISGQIIIDHSIITSNTAVGPGGGIFVENGQLTIRNSEITSNFSLGTVDEEGKGGGVAVERSRLTIVTSDLRGNSTDGNGNALYVVDPSMLSDGTTPSRLTDSCIVSNGNDADIYIEGNNAQFVAIRNWWGDPNGPNTGGDSITSVNVTTDISVYRVSEPQAYTLASGQTLLGCTEPYNVRFTNDGSTTWTDDQMKKVVEGVRLTGQALMQLLSEEDVTNTDAFSPEEAFNRVIVDHADNVFDGYVLFVKTTSAGTITVSNPDGDDFSIGPVDIACFAQEGSVANKIPQAIACNNFEADPHPSQTAVHEIGHLFDYRTGKALSINMGLNSAQALLTCNSEVIWGENSNKSITWTRGEDGWGSGPSRTTANTKLLTMFQRNPTFYEQGTGKNNEEILEAAADTFLNWVYRYVDDPDNSDASICPISGIDPDHWQDDPETPNIETFASGFVNRIWKGTTSDDTTNGTNGTRDNELKGDIRYVRAHTNIEKLIDDGGY